MLLTLFANHPLFAGSADAKDVRPAEADPSEHSFAVVLAETESGLQGAEPQLADFSDPDTSGTLSDKAEEPNDDVVPEREAARQQTDADSADLDTTSDRPATAHAPQEAQDQVETPGVLDAPSGVATKDVDPPAQIGVTAEQTGPKLKDNGRDLVGPGGPDVRKHVQDLPSGALTDKSDGQVTVRERPADKEAVRRRAAPDIGQLDRKYLPGLGQAVGKGKNQVISLPEVERIGDTPVPFMRARPDPRLSNSTDHDVSLSQKAERSDGRPVDRGVTQTEKSSVRAQADRTADRTEDPRIRTRADPRINREFHSVAQSRLERKESSPALKSEILPTGSGAIGTNRLSSAGPTGGALDTIGLEPNRDIHPRLDAERRALAEPTATMRVSAIPTSRKSEGSSDKLPTRGHVPDSDVVKEGVVANPRLSVQKAEPDLDANTGKPMTHDPRKGIVKTAILTKSDSIAPTDGKRRTTIDLALPDQDKHEVRPKHDTRAVPQDRLAGSEVVQKEKSLTASRDLQHSGFPQPREFRAKRDLPRVEPIKATFHARKDSGQPIMEFADPKTSRVQVHYHEDRSKPVGKSLDGVTAERLPKEPGAELVRSEVKDHQPKRLPNHEPQPVLRARASRSMTKDVPIRFAVPKDQAAQDMHQAARPETSARPDKPVRPEILHDAKLSGRPRLEPGDQAPLVRDAQTNAARPLLVETTDRKRPKSLPQDRKLQPRPRARIVWDRTVPPDAPARFVLRQAQGVPEKQVEHPAKAANPDLAKVRDRSESVQAHVGLTATRDPAAKVDGSKIPQAPRLPIDTSVKPRVLGAARIQDRFVPGDDATEVASLDMAEGQKARQPDLNPENPRILPNPKRNSARVADHPPEPRTVRLHQVVTGANAGTTEEPLLKRPVRRDEVSLTGLPDAARSAAIHSGHVTPVLLPETANRDVTIDVGRADRIKSDVQVEKIASRDPAGPIHRPLAKANEGVQFRPLVQQTSDADLDPAFKDHSADVELQNVRTADRITSSPTDPLSPQKPSTQPVTRQITEAVSSIREGQVTLRLSPEELGAVKLSMSMTDAGVTLHVQSARPETQDLIRRHIDQLKSELSSMGLGDVQVGFGGGHNPDQNTPHLPDDMGVSKPDVQEPEIDHPENAGLSGVDLRL